jgi:uncharacterized protein (TIGR02466 family)
MSLNLHPMFAVPFGEARCPDAEALNPQIRKLLLEREAQGDSHRNVHASLQQQKGVFESEFTLFSWPEACIQRLRAFCWSMLGQLVAEANGYTPAQMRQIRIFSHTWFHITRRPGFVITHTHPMASWSGVYCVDPGGPAPEYPESGLLRFHNPHFYSNVFLDPGNAHLKPPFHHGFWNQRLSAGQLVLFPSWLPHEVMPFHGDGERITIAFNCWFGQQGQS